MNNEDIEFGKEKFNLQFLAWYDYGQAKYDYLQIVRTLALQNKANGQQIEEQYWANMPGYRGDFAQAINGDFDAIVDPPSRSGYTVHICRRHLHDSTFAASEWLRKLPRVQK